MATLREIAEWVEGMASQGADASEITRVSSIDAAGEDSVVFAMDTEHWRGAGVAGRGGVGVGTGARWSGFK